MTSKYVLIVPSVASGDWRAALEEAASQSGWQMLMVRESLSELEVQDKSTIFVTESPTAFSDVPVKDLTVLHGIAEDVVDLLCLMDANASRHEVYGRASYYLSAAEALVQRGAQVGRAGESVCLHAGLPGISLSVPARATTGSILSLFDVFPAPSDVTLTWPAEILRYPQKSNVVSFIPGEIELTGPPRILCCGPYVHLTSGVWDLELYISIDIEDTPISIAFEWGDQFDAAAMPTRFDRSGRYRLDFSALLQSSRATELRISLTSALLHGRLKIESLRLIRSK